MNHLPLSYLHIRGLLLITGLVLCTNVFAAVNIFPFGIFDKSDPYGKFDSKPYTAGSPEWKSYRLDLLNIFKKYNINTVINTPYTNDSHARYVLDQLYDNGIDVVFQPRHPFNRKTEVSTPGYAKDSIYRHPSIIAFKLMDEPKTEGKVKKLKNWYRLIEKHYDQPIITAMIGEGMGEANDTFSTKNGKKKKHNMSLAAWQTLDSKILFARFYPYRRTHDLINWYREKMKMPFHEWCAYMETAYKNRPWWYIPQLAGKGKDKSHASYWRFPTSHELNALIHTALAYGARGIIGWSLPKYDYVQKSGRAFIVDQNLNPEIARDGSVPIEQYGKIGALVKKHAELLSRHRKAGFFIEPLVNDVLRVPRKDPKTNNNYIYVVNLNTENKRDTSIVIPAHINVTHAKDIYTEKNVQYTNNKGRTSLEYSLAPGEALFIKLD